MIKTKTIAVILMAVSSHRQAIAAARRPTTTPTNGLEMANQNENSHPELCAIEFTSMFLFKESQVPHFTKKNKVFARRNPIARVCTDGDDGHYGWLGLLKDRVPTIIAASYFRRDLVAKQFFLTSTARITKHLPHEHR